MTFGINNEHRWTEHCHYIVAKHDAMRRCLCVCVCNSIVLQCKTIIQKSNLPYREYRVMDRSGVQNVCVCACLCINKYIDEPLWMEISAHFCHSLALSLWLFLRYLLVAVTMNGLIYALHNVAKCDDANESAQTENVWKQPKPQTHTYTRIHSAIFHFKWNYVNLLPSKVLFIAE